MKVIYCDQVETAPVTFEGATACSACCLIGESDGAPSFSMRYFEVQPGGSTPRHAHGHEHEVFILEGAGVVVEEGAEHPLRPGAAVYVRPKEVHQFRNTGSGTLRFLCVIPHPLRGMTGPCAAACGCDA